MPRKPSAILDYKLRIREILRRRIEAAAKARAVSLNYEMTSRLERSFERDEMFKLDRITANMAQGWEGWGKLLVQFNRQDELAHATEKLIASVERAGVDAPEIKDAIDGARAVLTTIKLRRNQAS
jgi:hypothetical protein